MVPRRTRALRRAVAEGRAVACIHAHACRYSRARRTDGRDGCAGGGGSVRALPAARTGSHHHSHLASFLDGTYGRSDRRARSWSHRRAGKSRGAHAAERPLCASVHVTGARLQVMAKLDTVEILERLVAFPTVS